MIYLQEQYPKTKLLSFLIGEEEKQKLYSMIREKEGTKYVSLEILDTLTLEMMKQIEEKNKDVKNSESSPT